MLRTWLFLLQFQLVGLYIYTVVNINNGIGTDICFFALFQTAGYVDLPDVFRIGFIMALVNGVIWGVVGSFWWKFLGLC